MSGKTTKAGRRAAFRAHCERTRKRRRRKRGVPSACPHCGDALDGGVFAYGAHATIGCRALSARPNPATLPYPLR